MEFLHLIKYLEQARLQDDARRRQEEELCRQEDTARFTALLQMFAPASSQLDATSSGTATPLSPRMPQTTASPSTGSSVPPPQKAIAQNPLPLRADATFQVFFVDGDAAGMITQ